MKKVVILCLAWILIVLIATPSLASTEYLIPGSFVIIGFSEDVGLNISYSSIPPSIGTKIHQDEFNSTWCISPFNSPDGKMDIVIVPIDQDGFWEWLTSWI